MTLKMGTPSDSKPLGARIHLGIAKEASNKRPLLIYVFYTIQSCA